MTNTLLRVGPDRIIIDAKDISPISVNFTLKDIRNFGQRNSSFTKPISILQTKSTDRIFKSLFNINSHGGYDVGNKVYAEIIQDELVVMKGNMQVIDITEDTYEVVIAANNLSLFSLIGDKLIKGNQNVADDISWSGTPFQHTWNRELVRTWMNNDYIPDGTGYTYAFIAWDPKFAWPKWSLSNYALQAYTMMDDYPVLPSIAAKQIWDKIFDDNGFSYTLTPQVEEIFEELYIPFNQDWITYTADVSLYGKYYLGDPTAYSYPTTTVELTATTFQNGFLSTEVQPINSVKGWTFQDSYLGGGNTVSGGFDDIFDKPSNSHSGTTVPFDFSAPRFPLPHRGTFQLDISLGLFNSHPDDAGTSEWSVSVWNQVDGLQTYQIVEEEIASGVAVESGGTVTLSISQKSWYYIHRSTESSSWINLIFGSGSYVKVSEVNSLVGKSPVFDLNNMLPLQYKQKDFVNDILKMFNCFVIVDDIDERLMHIKTYSDFYSDSEFIDWTTKVTDLKHRPIKNAFAKTTNFKFTNDGDIYTQDYLSKFPDGIYTHYSENDSEFSGDDNDIVLSVAPGTLATIPDSKFNGFLVGFPATPVGGYPVLTISDDKQLKTNWKPRLLFTNTVDISTLSYGTDRENVDASINKFRTLSPRRDASIENGFNLFAGWDSENTYLNIPEESNITLYNAYYKEDIESNLDDDSRFLTAKVYLTAKDINEGNFNDKIYIENSKIGTGYYYINSIKNWNPGGGLCDVELLKLALIDSSYNTTINTNVVYRSLFGESTSASGVTGGSGSGGTNPATGNDLQAVTTNGNITNTGIVFENVSSPGSQVEINADENDNITIDGGLQVNDNVHVYEDVSVGINLYVGYSFYVDQDAEIGNDIIVKNDLNVTGNSNLHKTNVDGDLYVTEDVSVGEDLKTDSQLNHGPFFSGWAGVGYRLNKDTDGEYGLELDNLRVRGSMDVYELIVDKIRATNGSLWVSDGQQATWPGLDVSTLKPAGLYWEDSGTYADNWYYYTDTSMNTFRADDLILAQRFRGTNTVKVEYVVVETDDEKTYVRNFDQDRTTGDGYGSTALALYNGNVSSFINATTGALVGYDFIGNEGEYFYSQNFSIDGKGTVHITGGWQTPGGDVPDDHGYIDIEIQDITGDVISDTVRINLDIGSPDDFDITLTVNKDLGESPRYSGKVCKIIFNLVETSGICNANNFKIDSVDDQTLSQYLNGENEVDGFDFVRIGNLTDTDRQGSLYLTASDSGAPFLQVIDEMDTFTIGYDNQKVRLGNLEGIYDEQFGGFLDGYGLYTDNGFFRGNIYATDGYFSGTINALDGSIGGWSIGNNFLWSETTAGGIYINSNELSYSVQDSEGNEKIRISTDDLDEPDVLLGAPSWLFEDGSTALADITESLTTNNTPAYDDQYILYSAAASQLVDSGSPPSSTTQMIPIYNGKPYNISYDVKITATPNPALAQFHSINGNYTSELILRAYDEDDVQIFSETQSLINPGDYDFVTEFSWRSNLGVIDSSSMYFRLYYKIDNNLYDFNGIIADFPGVSMNTDFVIESTKVQIDGADGMMQITPQGMSMAWDSDQYFKIDGSTANTVADPFIHSSGNWVHEGDLSATIVKTVESGTSDHTLGDEDVYVNTSTVSRKIYIPHNGPVGKSYLIVNQTTNAGDTLVFWGETGTEIFRGGGNTSPTYVNAAGTVTYTLATNRCMEITKLSTGNWSWKVY